MTFSHDFKENPMKRIYHIAYSEGFTAVCVLYVFGDNCIKKRLYHIEDMCKVALYYLFICILEDDFDMQNM